MNCMVVPDESLDDWFAALKPYQVNALKTFMADQDALKAAELWLTTIGNPNIVGFGGVDGGNSNTKPYWDKFKDECRKFICNDSVYVEERKELLAHNPISKELMISIMSGAIGASMGAAGAAIAPAVVMVLYTIGKIGKGAYCSD